MLEKSEALQLRESFLAAMRTVANSVTVVTTDGEGGTHGATVSSFCSVSADPPTLLVCLNKESATGPAIRTNGRYCINILQSEQAGIARDFARADFDKEDALSIQPWTRLDGLPVLNGASAFICETSEVVEATSHLVLIGEVRLVQIGEKDPLIYINRRFRNMSKT